MSSYAGHVTGALQGLFRCTCVRNDTDTADLALGHSDRVDDLNLLGTERVCEIHSTKTKYHL